MRVTKRTGQLENVKYDKVVCRFQVGQRPRFTADRRYRGRHESGSGGV